MITVLAPNTPQKLVITKPHRTVSGSRNQRGGVSLNSDQIGWVTVFTSPELVGSSMTAPGARSRTPAGPPRR